LDLAGFGAAGFDLAAFGPAALAFGRIARSLAAATSPRAAAVLAFDAASRSGDGTPAAVASAAGGSGASLSFSGAASS
ncbi:MAG: hypothetical protein J2P35_20735, partial [Actinobacteria bacterium]|nr:hypothetical protein [Actinomycetota bacterium]